MALSLNFGWIDIAISQAVEARQREKPQLICSNIAHTLRRVKIKVTAQKSDGKSWKKYPVEKRAEAGA